MVELELFGTKKNYMYIIIPESKPNRIQGFK